MVTEYITLPHSATEEELAGLLNIGGGASIKVQRGQDAAGRTRSVIEIAHQDSAAVTLTRQNVLRACQRANIRAFVV